MKSSYIVNEGISSQELADVLFRRLEARYPDIVTNHGHEVVGDAVQNALVILESCCVKSLSS